MVLMSCMAKILATPLKWLDYRIIYPANGL